MKIADEEDAARKAAPTPGILGSLTDAIAAAQSPRRLAAIQALPGTSASDYRATAARRRDDLVSAHQRALQQAEDYEGELRRLRQAHADIVRPDGRLWWGVGILIAFAVVGVAVPLWVMGEGPKNLASVRWLFWLFAAALGALLGYIVVYLFQLTRARPPRSSASPGRT